MLLAGPGWVIFGAIKQVIGLFLAVYIIANVADGAATANQPVHQFLEIYQGFLPGWAAMALAVILVVISQIKINVTNAYSGSLAWTNSSPGSPSTTRDGWCSSASTCPSRWC